MIAYHIALSIGFICLAALIIVRVYRGSCLAAMVLKVLCSLLFVASSGIIVLISGRCTLFAVLISGGLLLGMLGDIWLDLRYMYPADSDQWTIMGFLFFGTGHLFYFAAAFSISGFQPVALLTGFSAMVIVVVVFIPITEKLMHLQYGRFSVITTVYGAVLIFTPAYTLCSAFLSGGNDSGLFVLGIGCTLFLFSDLVLSVVYFGHTGRSMIAVDYILYYTAQYIIASSALYAFESGL